MEEAVFGLLVVGAIVAAVIVKERNPALVTEVPAGREIKTYSFSEMNPDSNDYRDEEKESDETIRPSVERPYSGSSKAMVDSTFSEGVAFNPLLHVHGGTPSTWKYEERIKSLKNTDRMMYG